MDITQKFRNVVRAIVGMPEDPGQPPQIDRLAWYRAQVTACASDGSTCDVQCEDVRIGGANKVTVLVGLPGAAGAVSPGAVVMLGWERGDPARPRCMPLWESGATVTKLILNALSMYLGGESGAQPAARKTDAVKVTVPINTFLTAATGGVLNSAPVVLTGTITAGSAVVNIK